MGDDIGPFNQGIVSRGTELMMSLINAAQSSKDNDPPLRVTDNIPVVFQQYMDWARNNPELVNKRTLQLMFSMNDDIFSLFEPKEEKRSVHQWSVIDMPPFRMDEMSMKAPARFIHRKAEHFVEHSVWTGIGFMLDWHFLQTPGGIDTAYQLTLYVNSLTIAYFQMSCYRAFFNAVSYYQRPEQRVIGDNLPLDIYAAINYANQEFGIFAKSAGVIKNGLVRYDQIFQQTSNTVGNLIVSSDFIDCIFGKASQLVEGKSAGPAEATANRDGSDKVRRIGNVGLIPSPLTSRQVHDNKSEFVMFTETSKGSFWRFPLDYLQQTLPSEFDSELMGTVRAYSYETDRLDDYKFIDFLHHCPEFIPATGAINYPLLKRFLDQGSPVDYAGSFGALRAVGAPRHGDTRYKITNAMNMFEKCKMNWSQNNFGEICNRMHMFINHLDRDRPHEATPVCCIGEMDEYHMPTDKLRYYGQNFAERMFECLTAAELIEFKKCVVDIMKANSGDIAVILDELTLQLNAAAGALDAVGNTGVPAPIIVLINAYDADLANVAAGAAAAPAVLPAVQPVSGYGTVPIMYFYWSQGDDADLPIKHLSFRYITLLKKLVGHFETLTDNHVASNLHVFPSHIDLTNAGDHELHIKKLTIFHHLLILPQYKFAFLENLGGIGGRAWGSRMLPLATPMPYPDTNPIPARAGAPANSNTTYDGMLRYHGTLDADSYMIYTSILASGERPRNLYLDLSRYSARPDIAPIDKLIEQRRVLYDEEPVFAERLHPVILQHMLFNLQDNRFFADRWGMSFREMELAEGIGFRALLLDMINTREFDVQHSVNRAIPFSGMVLRGDELQRTMSIPVVANGSVGKFFYDKDYKFISFDQNTQQYNIMSFAQFAPIVTDNKKFFIAENAWGGEALGGKGRHYINEDTDITPDNEQRWRDLISKIGYGDRLLNHCNVPVLQSLRTGLETIYQTAIDRRGWFSPDDFIGLYEHDDAFRNRDDVMYDNCLFANFIYRFPNIAFPRNANNAYSFQDKANRYRINNICCETTTIVYDHFSSTKTREIKSSHAWGDQKAGSIKRETGIVGPDYLNDDSKARHEDSIQRKRKLHDITDSDYQIVFQ